MLRFHLVSNALMPCVGDVVTSRLSGGRAGIRKVLQMDISSGMLQRDQTFAQVLTRLYYAWRFTVYMRPNKTNESNHSMLSCTCQMLRRCIAFCAFMLLQLADYYSSLHLIIPYSCQKTNMTWLFLVHCLTLDCYPYSFSPAFQAAVQCSHPAAIPKHFHAI